MLSAIQVTLLPATHIKQLLLSRATHMLFEYKAYIARGTPPRQKPNKAEGKKHMLAIKSPRTNNCVSQHKYNVTYV